MSALDIRTRTPDILAMLGFLILFAAAAALLLALGTIAVVLRLTHPPRFTYAVALARRVPSSPTDLRLEFSIRELRLSDNHTTPAWVIHGRDESGPVVVITHGWGDSRYGALEWVELLAPYASAIVTYDLRGMGESSAPACHLGTTEIDDLVIILTQLGADRPIVLFGASMGVGISIAAAARAAAKGNQHVIGVVGDGGYRHGMEPIVGYFKAQQWPVLPFYYPIGAWLSLVYATHSQFDRARHARGLACPLLLLHGTDDPICPIASAREIIAAVPPGSPDSPRARIVEFPGGTHLDLITHDPETYKAELTAFFQKIQPPATTHEPLAIHKN